MKTKRFFSNLVIALAVMIQLFAPSVVFAAPAAAVGGPTVTIVNAGGQITALDFDLTITFSEAVVGFSEYSILVDRTASLWSFTEVSQSEYTVTIHPLDGEGSYTILIPADRANAVVGGLGNQVSESYAIVYDSTAPYATLSSSVVAPTDVSPIPLTITFNEEVVGFALTDLSIVGGTAGNLQTADNTVFTADITPTADGTIIVQLPASQVQDLAGSWSNSSSNQLTFSYDATAPSVEITSTVTDPTETSPIPVTFTFDEDVTGFTVEDITVGNGAAGNFDDTNAPIYTADITPAGLGTVTVGVAAAAAQDAIGHESNAATQYSVEFASIAPTIIISSTASPATNVSLIPVTFTFSEEVTGFDITDIVVGNGTVDNFDATAAPVYTADVTATAEGDVTVDVAAGAAADLSANDSQAAVQFSIAYDLTNPTAIISSLEVDPTNNSPFVATFTFDEDVTNFTIDDITVTNGAASNFASIGNTVFTADITPAADGDVLIDVAADAATDLAGNGNDAATQYSITYDGTAPTVDISSAVLDPTNNDPIPVTFTFSEDVTGFEIADITVGNGSAGNFAGSGSVYSADITPTMDGVVTVDVDASVAEDAAGNANDAATQYSVEFDGTGPIASLIMGLGETATNVSPLVIGASFSEVVTDFDINDLVITNGVAGNFTGGGDAYEFEVTPSAEGFVTIAIAADSVTDGIGNGNAETSLDIDYDTTSPSVVISSVVVDPTSTFPIPVSAAFDEDVTGFDETDLLIGNGTVSNFVAVSDSEYTFDIIPTAEGEVTVDIDADVASDAAGNFNTAATQWSVTYFLADLSVAISSAESVLTNLSPFEITITFSETPIGFGVGDISVGNGTVSNFAGSGSVYTADITPAADGEVTVDIAAGVAETAGGSLNSAATQFSIEYDGTRPSVVVSSIQSTPTNDSPITITVEFDEDVTGLAASDFTVTGATLGTLSGSGASYTLEVTPSASGYVTVTLGDEQCSDAAGNLCEASTAYTIQYDITRPGVVITNPSDGHITFTFSESVTGFALVDISVSGGSLSNFAGSGATYTADVTASAASVNISVPADVAVDAAGNTNTASSVFTYAADTVAPSLLSISRLDANPTKAASVRFSVTFSEPVDSLDNGDLALAQSGVTGAAITGITGSGSIYTVTVSTGTGSGSIELRLSTVNNIQDLVGNPLAAVTVASEAYTIDRSPVSLSASTMQLNLLQSAASLNVQFTEDVYNPAGNTDTDDVTNPNNFLLLQTGADGVYNTTTCAAGVSAADVRITVNSVTYNNTTFTATLNVNNGVPLTPGNYRLIVCGTTSVTDLAGNSLNGGNDVTLDVVVWDRVAPQPNPIPVTGFAPASAMPAGLRAAYQPTGATLSISSIGLNAEMVSVPFKQNDWDITWLGDKVGVLVGLNQLDQPGNTVITGHNWDYNDAPGPFLKLTDVAVGEKISIYTAEGTFTFTVVENKVVDQYDLDAAFGQADEPTITLVTCDGYNAYSKTFTQRRIVRAVMQ